MWGYAALCALVLVGCANKPFPCTASDQCVASGNQGVCQPEGFCSFPDGECPNGQRFEPNAGNGLGGACVDHAPMPDGGMPTTCGAVGQACCTTELTVPCFSNGFCDNGTCKQCIVDAVHGADYSCFRKYDNTVWCSGYNDTGQLANGGLSTTPVNVTSQVRDTSNQPLRDVAQLGGGEQYACVTKTDKTVWCWGDNEHGDGDGTIGDGTTNDAELATRVLKESDNMPLTNIVEVKGSYCHTCARDENGGVWCWGCNPEGQLGDGTAVTQRLRAAPVLASPGGPAFTGAQSLVMGGEIACVTKSGGEVWCWGDNGNSAIGDNSMTNATTPVLVMTGAASISPGRRHTCATKPDKSAWCWGLNRHRRLGTQKAVLNPANDTREMIPAQVVVDALGTPFTGAERAANDNAAMSCLMTSNTGASCWGDNLYGQTGTGVGGSVPAPVLGIDGKPLLGIERITTGYTRACAFLTNGQMMCWGRNAFGQLGDATFTNRGLATPTQGVTCP